MDLKSSNAGVSDALVRSIATRSQRNALMLGTALGAFFGMSYGRGAYGQNVVVELSGHNLSTVEITGPGTFETQEGFSVVESGGGDGITMLVASGETEDTSLIDNYESLIVGSYHGVFASNQGSGALSITTSGEVEGVSQTGIFTRNSGSGVSVEAYNVTGGEHGIYLFNQGTGSSRITMTGPVEGRSYSGVYAINTISGSDITISGEDVTGFNFGIFTLNYGNGDLRITSTGTIEARGGDGILAVGEGANFSISGSNVTGDRRGIFARNEGSGELRITTTGAVAGARNDGVYGYNTSNGTNLIIHAHTVSGGETGITARNYGSGDLSIHTSGDVYGLDYEGITARNASGGGASSGGGDLTIVAGNVSGSEGIAAYNGRGGTLSITSTGNVVGRDGIGVRAFNAFSATDLYVSLNNVQGYLYGVRATNFGTGVLRVDVTGQATSTYSSGLSAINGLTASDLIVEANNVNGYYDGINAVSSGAGSISITTTGAVEGETGDGIFVQNTIAASEDVTISASDVTGAEHGIYAFNSGYGALSVTSTGDVSGVNEDGIFAQTVIGTDLTIIAQNVTGFNGITARRGRQGANAGVLSIATDGDVEGVVSDGIDALAFGGLTISARNVSGRRNGIIARNYGSGPFSGPTSITVTGDVIGVTDDGIFVNAQNNSNGDLTIAAVNVMGGRNGIYANNNGSVPLSITTTGNVVGNSVDGISARNVNASTDLTISVNNISGYQDGIDARDYGWGTGDLSITTDTDSVVRGTTARGIYARQLSQGDLTIATAARSTVFGGDVGIFALLEGTGGLEVFAEGAVTGGSYGIHASISNASNINDILITTGTSSSVSALDYDGMRARHNGRGDIIVAANGVVTDGSEGAGISAVHTGSGNVSVTAGEGSRITGWYNGIEAVGSSAIAVAVAADAYVQGYNGIAAEHQGSSGNLLITTGKGSEVQGGILAQGASGVSANSIGSIEITIGGKVVNESYEGIRATLGAVEGDLDITTDTGSVVAGRYGGIVTVHGGIGDISVSANGNIIGAVSTDEFQEYQDFSGPGIFAIHNGLGNVTVTTGTASQVSGFRDEGGVGLIHTGIGALAVTVGEDSRVDGVGANHLGSSGNVEITTERGSVVDLAVVAQRATVGSIDVEIGGEVRGDINEVPEDAAITDFGAVLLRAPDGSTIDITVGDTGRVVAGENGLAIVADAKVGLGGEIGMARTLEASAGGGVTLNNLGTIIGAVDLSNSNLFLNSGTWNTAGLTSDFNATGDSLVVNEGLIVASTGAAGEVTVLENLDQFRSSMGGILRLADGVAGDVFEIRAGTGTGNFMANGGIVELDAFLGDDSSASDRLVVSGDVRLEGAPTGLLIFPVGGGVGGQTKNGIEVVEVGGASDEGAFVLANAAPLEAGAFVYELSLGNCTDQTDQSWYLCNTGQVGTVGALFEAMPGVLLNTFARAETRQQRLSTRVQGANTTVSTRGTSDFAAPRTTTPWMRSWGDFADITPDHSMSGVSWEASSWGLQAGLDAEIGDPAAGSLIGGVHLRYSGSNANLVNAAGTGRVETEGVGVGASLTWLGNDGLYADLQGAVDWISVDARSSSAGTVLDGHDDVVYSLSGELGKRFTLEDGLSIIPQMQVSWGSLRDGELQDALGNVVRFSDRDSLIGRVGLTVERGVTESGWGSGTIYGFGNLLHDFAGERAVTVAGTELSQSGSGSWAEIGGGLSLTSSNDVNFYGQVAYRHAVADVEGEALSLSAGLRVQW